jgi:transcriptional regulator with XRE-family HTH domain
MPGTSALTSVVDQQLLLQLGERLKLTRLRQGLTTIEMAAQAGLSRMTLRAIEAGEPTPTMGSYLRVMGVLGISKDLALLAAEVQKSPARPRTAPGAPKEVVAVIANTGHELQDLQSLVLHQEAVRLMKQNPDLIQKALDTLNRWRSQGSSSSQVLWDEWSVILHRRTWRRALSNTQRSRELRQASPLTTVLPADTRKRILDEVQGIRTGETANGLPRSAPLKGR